MSWLLAVCAALGADEGVRALPERVGVSISPTTALGAVRFVHDFGDFEGRLFVQLDMADKLDLVSSTVFEYYENWDTFPGNPIGPFDPEREADFCMRLDIEPKARYVVLLPFEEKVVAVESAGVAIFYEGGSGGFTVCHVIDVGKPERIDERGRFGVAYGAEGEPSVEFSDTVLLGHDELETMGVWLKERTQEETLRALAAIKINDDGARMVVVRVRESDFLYWLNVTDDAYSLVSLRDPWHADGEPVEEGLAIEDRPGEWDTAMHNTRIALLPDLDGNGMPEILIHSTDSYVIDPTAETPIVDSVYFGP